MGEEEYNVPRKWYPVVQPGEDLLFRRIPVGGIRGRCRGGSQHSHAGESPDDDSLH